MELSVKMSIIENILAIVLVGFAIGLCLVYNNQVKHEKNLL
jgi:hypothetical protein